MKGKLIKLLVWIVCLSSFVAWISLIYSDEVSLTAINFLYCTVWSVLVLTVVLILYFSLADIFKSKESFKRFAIYLLLTLGVFIVSYSVASGDAIKFIDGTESSSNVSKLTGMGLYVLYIFSAVSVLVVLLSELKVLKK